MPTLSSFLKSHPLLFKTLRFVGVLLVVLLALVLYVVFIGVSIDASSQRGKVAALLAENLGREVRFEGAMQVEISAHPKLRIGGLHIANASGFGSSEFASLGEVRLALNLWALLATQLQVDELSGADVHISLQQHKDGSNNWTFNPHSSKQTQTKPASAGVALSRVFERVDIKHISLSKLDVDFIPAGAKAHSFELQSLLATIPAGQPITLTLNGTVEKKYPYNLDFTGGTIADLGRMDKPWPISLMLEFLSSRLSINGNVSGDTGVINFGLGTENLSEFEQLLQTKLPAVGIAGIVGDINYAPGKVALNNLSAIMGKTSLEGNLNFDYSGKRPRVQGELEIPELDLQPFMTDKPAAQEEPPKNFSDVYKQLSEATFNLKGLNSADADLTLRVGKWLNLPGEVHDAKLQVKLENGHLSVPVQATLADVFMSGSASADASVTPARFDLALATHDSNLGNLAEVLLGMPGVKGELGRFALRIGARGDRGYELMDSLDVRLDVARSKLTYGNGKGGRPVRFTLDKLTLALPARKALHAEMKGSLLDKAFSAKLQGDSLTNIMREARVPLDFELQAASARAQIHADLQSSAEGSSSEVTFALSAPHSGEIADWLGLKPGADAPISVRGNFQANKTSWHLAGFNLKLGRSDVSADVLRTSDNGKPLIKLQLTGELIDVDQLHSLLPKAKKAAPVATSSAKSMIDIPILPTGVDLADADIMVRIKRIASASPLSVQDIHFDGRIRDGMMYASPFAVNVAENDFSGAIQLDLRSQQPHSVLWLATDDLDIGSVLNKLGIASDIDADVAHVGLQLDLNSSRLGKLLEHSELAFEFDGGHLTLHDANSGGKMRIALEKGELKSAAGDNIYLDLLGKFDNVPVSINLETAKAIDLINPALAIPFTFTASAANSAIQLSGEVQRPFSNKDIVLALNIGGASLDDLNFLTHTSLPPWGPWSASGNFHMSSIGYEVSSLLLQVGSSLLNGDGKLDTTAVPPRIDLALAAPKIQLDDFEFGDWSPENSKPAASKKSKTELRKQAVTASNQAQKMLSQEVLQRQNAYLTVRVDSVVSGADILGSGTLDAKLHNGRADIGPIVVNTPSGSASFKFGYEPGEKDVAVDLYAKVKHFDYGVLARRFDPKSEMSGNFSLDVDVNARAQYLSELLRYGNGNIDFEVWPQNLKSGLLDIWAVNVLTVLLSNVDKTHASKVNCAIGSFALNDGLLSDKNILIDTTRMRVKGKGEVNFATKAVQLYVKPRAKTPQLFSLALPIAVTGSFDDFKVGVRPLDVLETVWQFATSIVWVPIQLLFGKKIPADGSDVCGV